MAQIFDSSSQSLKGSKSVPNISDLNSKGLSSVKLRKAESLPLNLN